MSLRYKLFVVACLFGALGACKGESVGRPWSELFARGSVGIGGPFAAIDMHGDPEAARATAPDYFENWHEIPEVRPRLRGLVKPELVGGSEPVLVVMLDVKGHLPRIERTLRDAWGEPITRSAGGSMSWLDPAKRIGVDLDARHSVLEQIAYTPIARYLGEGATLTFGGTSELLGATLDTLASEHGKALKVTTSLGGNKPIAYLELARTEHDQRSGRVSLDLDATNTVTGYDVRFGDGGNGERLRAAIVAKWGAPQHAQDRGKDGWQLDWSDRQLAFSHGAMDIRVGTKVWPRAPAAQ